MIDGLVEAAKAMMTGLPPRDGWIDTHLCGLRIRRIAHGETFECDLKGPLCGVVLQGTKETVTGQRRFIVPTGSAVIVSHHVPAVSRAVEASENHPYIAAMLPLDLAALAALGHEVGS